jgi:hypothetical protein
MVDDGAQVKGEGWLLYDAIVAHAAEGGYTNPWSRAEDGRVVFRPDYDTLRRLLAVPVLLNATSQSGIPAFAYDVWVAYELRRAGFDEDAVWPRASQPRILPHPVTQVVASSTRRDRQTLEARLAAGDSLGGAVAASARILGKNYVKQVDVVMSSWETGPEIMISTKRMDSSFSKNAANRVEESYGDAKNLRLRHPLAALGFVYGLNATALTIAADKAEWLMDLLTKLGREDDAYDGVALVIPEYESAVLVDSDAAEDGDVLVDAGVAGPISDFLQSPVQQSYDIDARLALLPQVRLRLDVVPPALTPDRFFERMVGIVLDASPVTFHRPARSRLKQASMS